MLFSFLLYSSSKKYVNYFTKAIQAESFYDSAISNIDFTLYSPSFVSTKINGMPEVPFIIPSPISAAKTALHDVGRFKYTNGRLFDAILCIISTLLDTYLSPILDLAMWNDGKEAFEKR